jgi:hypothetical protein
VQGHDWLAGISEHSYKKTRSRFFDFPPQRRNAVAGDSGSAALVQDGRGTELPYTIRKNVMEGHNRPAMRLILGAKKPGVKPGSFACLVLQVSAAT